MDPIQETQSLWQMTDKPFAPPLSFDVSTDICVVGAGIAGLTTAYLFVKEGKDVVVIDRDRIGMNETGRTSAHLSNALDESFVSLRRMHGDQGAKLAGESHARAIDLIEQIVREENIDCDFKRVDGYLFCGAHEDVEDLRQELEAVQASGFSSVEMIAQAPVPLFSTGVCLRYPEQAQFHPVKYLAGLANAITKLGGKIFTHTNGVDFKGGFPSRVMTSQGFQINCDSIVMAMNASVKSGLALQTKLAAYRSYVIGVKAPKSMIPDCLLWDTEEPYHYLRLVKNPELDYDTLLVGGEDHRVGQETHPEECYSRLQDWVRNRLHLEPEVVSRWSGQVLEPMDGLAFIGRNPEQSENVFLITGDSGHGLTHGTLGAMIIRDLVLERENPWAELYDPMRVNWRGLNTYIKEAAKSSAPYMDWVLPGDVNSVDEIEPGQGATLRDGLKKWAVYKDNSGTVHTCSATCPHMDGIVRWNSSEKTWDCPCHGSRFDKITGEVINGPAITGLKPAEEPTVHHELPIASLGDFA